MAMLRSLPRDLDGIARPPMLHIVTYNICMDLTLSELEQAINYWRALRPSTGEERALSPEVNVLATVYALMIFQRVKSIPLASLPTAAQQLFDSWRRQAA